MKASLRISTGVLAIGFLTIWPASSYAMKHPDSAGQPLRKTITGGEVWAQYLPADHRVVHRPRTISRGESPPASPPIWNAYLPQGPVGHPHVSPYTDQQLRSRIPWSAHVRDYR